MVTVIPKQERKRMGMEELQAAYDGKWVFLVQTEDVPFSAVPVVVADEPYEGSESELYEQFSDGKENGVTGHVSLLLSASMLGFEVF